MIYRFRFEFDPITTIGHTGYVDAADFAEAVEQANLLMQERGVEIHSKPEHMRLTLVEETDVRIVRPEGRRGKRK